MILILGDLSLLSFLGDLSLLRKVLEGDILVVKQWLVSVSNRSAVETLFSSSQIEQKTAQLDPGTQHLWISIQCICEAYAPLRPTITEWRFSHFQPSISDCSLNTSRRIPQSSSHCPLLSNCLSFIYPTPSYSLSHFLASAIAMTTGKARGECNP